MTLEEYYGAGEYENYRPTAAQLCPVIYGLSEEDDNFHTRQRRSTPPASLP
jgi:hypothetical protein